MSTHHNWLRIVLPLLASMALSACKEEASQPIKEIAAPVSPVSDDTPAKPAPEAAAVAEPAITGKENTLGPDGKKLLAETQLDVPNAGQPIALAFKFPQGALAHYSMRIEGDIKVQAGMMGKQAIKMDMQLDFDHKVKEAGEAGVVDLPFTGQRIKLDMNMMEQEIHVDIDGQDVLAKMGGMTMVDTKNGVGEEMAGDFLKDMNFAGNSVQVSIDRRGKASNWKGDDTLVELFSDNSGGEGLMPLVLPAEPVTIGKPWWSKTILHKLNNISLKGDPLEGLTRFVVVGTENVDGKDLVKIQMDAPMLIENKKAKVELEDSGMTADATFTRMDRKAKGTILFDPARGLVVSAIVDVDLEGNMAMEMMGQKIDMDLSAKMKIGIKEGKASRLPASPAATKGQTKGKKRGK